MWWLSVGGGRLTGSAPKWTHSFAIHILVSGAEPATTSRAVVEQCMCKFVSFALVECSVVLSYSPPARGVKSTWNELHRQAELDFHTGFSPLLRARKVLSRSQLPLTLRKIAHEETASGRRRVYTAGNSSGLQSTVSSRENRIEWKQPFISVFNLEFVREKLYWSFLKVWEKFHSARSTSVARVR